MNTTSILNAAASSNDITKVTELISQKGITKEEYTQALTIAAYKGHEEIVKLLIPLSDTKANKSKALRNAVTNKHKECVELLIPVSDTDVILTLQAEITGLGINLDQYIYQYRKKPVKSTKDELSERLIQAALDNDVFGARLLLVQGADAKYKESLALKYAVDHALEETKTNKLVYYLDTEMVKLLIPVSDWSVVHKLKPILADKLGVEITGSQPFNQLDKEFYYAIKHNMLDVVKKLVAMGADPKTQSSDALQHNTVVRK